MNDFISKQVAIDALAKDIMGGLNYENILKELPTADVRENVHGEWENVDGIYKLATCSKCKKITMFETWGNKIRVYDFCPNCGADMRDGEADDESRIN